MNEHAVKHAAKRLAERYGIRDHADAMVKSLKARLLHGRARFRRPLNGGRSEWESYVAGKRIRFVWEESTETVVTVLPRRAKRRRMEAA
jgi:hypothetical protein